MTNLIAPHSPRINRMHSHASRLIANDDFAGIAWRLTQAGDTVSEGVVGHADHAREHELRNDAIFRIYSMTKPIVSIVALQLVEENVLGLGDAVATYIPAFAKTQVLGANGKLLPLNRPITVEDLLTHRSGLSYDFQFDCPIAGLYREASAADDASRSLGDLVDVLANTPLLFQPGSRWYYSYATDVLAHLLEQVTGESLPSLLQSRIFQPLGMVDTAYSVPDAAQHRLASMFGMRNLGEAASAEVLPQTLLAMDVESSYPSNESARFVRGGHGLFSTIDDYCKFMHVLFDGRSSSGEPLLSAPMVQMMWQNRIPASQLPLRIAFNEIPGYGWNLFGRVMLDTGMAMSLTAEGEGGWAGAAQTYFWIDRRNAISGVVMSQFLGSSIAMGNEMQNAAYQCFV